MRVTVVGKQKLQGKSKKTGNALDGTIVFFESISPMVEGVRADSTIVMSSHMDFNEIKVGKDLMLDYDRSGYLVSVTPL